VSLRIEYHQLVDTDLEHAWNWRMPSEGEELLDWMKRNEGSWRR